MTMLLGSCTCLLYMLHVVSVYCGGGRRNDYSNEWLLEAELSPHEVQKLAAKYGMEYSHEVVEGFHVLMLPFDPVISKYQPVGPCLLSSEQRQIMDHPKIKNLQQQRYLYFEERGRVKPKSMKIKDDSWSEMWYLHRDLVPSMNVYEAWEMGYSGKGVKVAVLDDGVDMDHPDLMGNYIPEYSYDFLYENNYPIHNARDFHGTFCAGIIAATKNKECVIGVAYNSKFAALKVHDNYFELTPATEAMALIHELPHIDIYSISLGPADSGLEFEGPDDVIYAALLKGVTEGRNGKGAVYVWAAGNGGEDDNCNCDGFVSSIYTIGITSISMDLAEAWYSERCTSIMAGTYGGDEPNPAVSTTNAEGGCEHSFQGTSATCPMASGIIALVLEANPALSWRDIQHLIVNTASHENLNHSTSVSGAGRQVNQYFGFGLMNAERMINRSLSWKTVPDQVVCRSPDIILNRLSINGLNITSAHSSDGCGGTVRYLEHVQARVLFQSAQRGAMEIFLTSPSGLESQLLTIRPYDYSRSKLNWTFMTVHHWGEDPTGDWQLRVALTGPNLENITNLARGRNERVIAEREFSMGTIVGGSVGGVALLMVVIATIFLLITCRRSKNNVDAGDTKTNEQVDGLGPSFFEDHF